MVVIVVAGVVTAVLVVVVALAAIGRESYTLGTQPRQSIFDLEEAVEFVAERLPPAVTASISYDDVRALLGWHLEYLADRGVPAYRDQNRGGPVVIEDDEGVAFVLMKADGAGLEVTDEEVASVLEGELAYFAAIGAVGTEVADPLELDPGEQPPQLPEPPGPPGAGEA